MKRSIKKQIEHDIFKETWRYFRFTDLYFTDYVYGDPYYQGTLKDVVCSYVVKSDLNWGNMHKVTGIIDVVELVTDLYQVFIKADTYFRNQYCEATERNRKNYLMKSLRNATPRLLDQQLDNHNRICQDLEELKNRSGCYFSLDSQDGRLLEDISLKQWQDERDVLRERERCYDRLHEVSGILNNREKAIISLLLKDYSQTEIAEMLNLNKDSIRKFVYSAKKKMREREESLN